MTVLVTGGAGYLGSVVTRHLLARGHEVVIVDSLLHGQHTVAEELRRAGARFLAGDVRDDAVIRSALAGVSSVVHLAAIVGDVACREQPELSDTTNVDASVLLARRAAESGIERFVFASTCSNYGVVDEEAPAVDEDQQLNPVSRYARQKVRVEQYLATEHGTGPMVTTCLRLSTLFGASDRMRFDLLVNEFVRDLWADRQVDVYGTTTWRPYVHVADAARAVELALARTGRFATYNVGSDEANHRKLDLARLVAAQVGRGSVVTVPAGPDPRSYRVSFQRIRDELGFEAEWTVPRGVDELQSLLAEGRLDDPFHTRHVNA